MPSYDLTPLLLRTAYSRIKEVKELAQQPKTTGIKLKNPLNGKESVIHWTIHIEGNTAGCAGLLENGMVVTHPNKNFPMIWEEQDQTIRAVKTCLTGTCTPKNRRYHIDHNELQTHLAQFQQPAASCLPGTHFQLLNKDWITWINGYHMLHKVRWDNRFISQSLEWMPWFKARQSWEIISIKDWLTEEGTLGESEHTKSVDHLIWNYLNTAPWKTSADWERTSLAQIRENQEWEVDNEKTESGNPMIRSIMESKRIPEDVKTVLAWSIDGWSETTIAKRLGANLGKALVPSNWAKKNPKVENDDWGTVLCVPNRTLFAYTWGDLLNTSPRKITTDIQGKPIRPECLNGVEENDLDGITARIRTTDTLKTSPFAGLLSKLL